MMTTSSSESQDVSPRLLAIGDIHGHYDKLVDLMALVAPTNQDQLVFVGDYIDRGPDSMKVIDYLLDLQACFPATIFLRGNHEQMLLDTLNARALLECYAKGIHDSAVLEPLRRPLTEQGILVYREELMGCENTFRGNGGGDTLTSYGGDFDSIPEKHVNFITATTLYHLETRKILDPVTRQTANCEFVFVHAGVRPKRPLEEQDPFDFLWIRDQFIKAPNPCGGRIVVHGHTPSPNVPGKHPKRICVDSGVYVKGQINKTSRSLGGKLSCCDVVTRQVWQA